VSGASRHHIFLQFIIEAVVISLLSLGLAYTMMQLLQPTLLELLPEKPENKCGPCGLVPLFSVFAGLLAGIITGIYPVGFQASAGAKESINSKAVWERRASQGTDRFPIQLSRRDHHLYAGISQTVPVYGDR
jgi:hypothetical protein